MSIFSIFGKGEGAQFYGKFSCNFVAFLLKAEDVNVAKFVFVKVVLLLKLPSR